MAERLKNRVFTQKRITVEGCRANPNTIYVFGDNLVQRGRAGQAIIRDEPNARGIPTKRYPSMHREAFFSDKGDEFIEVKYVLAIIYHELRNNKDLSLCLPEDGLGTGLAKMEEKSPELYKYMNQYINDYFGVKY